MDRVTSLEGPDYFSLEPYVHWTGEPRPVDWRGKFGRGAPLHAEIGFGLGDYLVRQAADHPDRDFVGIELEWVLVRRALRKIALARVNNARIIRADARIALERLFDQRSLSGACALFPCPWPKRKHVENRLFTQDFLRLVNSRLLSGGELLMVTDEKYYMEWVLDQVPGTGFDARFEIMPPRFATKYERKWQELGRQEFYGLRLRKDRHVEIPLKEEKDLITYRIERFDPGSFHPSKARGRFMVEFKEFLFDPGLEKGMVRSVVGEDNLLQNFWIEIVRREGRWHIRPAKGCAMIPTAGVQRALDLVRDAADPDRLK
jgi:tRNA (guanine-N7-)-methyltransferase